MIEWLTTAPRITGTLAYNCVLGFGEFTLGFLVFSILPPRHDTGHTLRTISLGVVMLLVLDAFCTIPPPPRAPAGLYVVFSFYQCRRSSI